MQSKDGLKLYLPISGPLLSRMSVNLNKVKVKDEISAEETFAKTKKKQKLDTYHPFGCPVLILDLALQGSLGKIACWNPESRVGVYLEHSPRHASNVALVLNVSTGCVSPQYHLNFDNDFTPV